MRYEISEAIAPLRLASFLELIDICSVVENIKKSGVRKSKETLD